MEAEEMPSLDALFFFPLHSFQITFSHFLTRR